MRGLQYCWGYGHIPEATIGFEWKHPVSGMSRGREPTPLPSQASAVLKAYDR
jgi:hypothetical protein